MISTPITNDLLRGFSELETTARGIRPHRLPAWARHQFPDGQLLSMESQPAGVRLLFSTTATRIELVVHPTYSTYRGIDLSVAVVASALAMARHSTTPRTARTTDTMRTAPAMILARTPIRSNMTAVYGSGEEQGPLCDPWDPLDGRGQVTMW